MPTTHYKYVSVPADKEKYGDGRALNTLKASIFDAFGTEVLGLGDLASEGETFAPSLLFLTWRVSQHSAIKSTRICGATLSLALPLLVVCTTSRAVHGGQSG